LNALREQVRQLGLEDVVQFPGFVDDIKSVYPHVEVLVHPALMEGLGVALIEASYARVPVIATRVGGIPEIVRDRENGILIPPADSTAIRNAMLELLAQPDLRKTLGEGGRMLALREFAVEPMAAGNAQVYRSVLS
ncbi:MAG: glycosyltransferase, partial [Puniceicoccaceae bacterium]